MGWLQALGVIPRWERVLPCQAEVRQRLRVEKLAQVLVHRRRSDCVRGWIEVEEALAGLVQLGVSMVLGEGDPLRGKVALDLLLQVVQEVVMVSLHHHSVEALDRVDLVPTNLLTRSSLSYPYPLKAELDSCAVLVPVLLVGSVLSREDRADLQGTSLRFRRQEYARLEVRPVLRAAGYLVEQGWDDCSTKLG